MWADTHAHYSVVATHTHGLPEVVIISLKQLKSPTSCLTELFAGVPWSESQKNYVLAVVVLLSYFMCKYHYR